METTWDEPSRHRTTSPFRTGILLAAAAVGLQILLMSVLVWGERRRPPAVPVEDPLDDEMVEARRLLAEQLDPSEAVRIGETALVERGPRADAYAVIGEGYLKMGRVDEARRHLYLATISPGPDEDRLRARDLLESLFK